MRIFCRRRRLRSTLRAQVLGSEVFFFRACWPAIFGEGSDDDRNRATDNFRHRVGFPVGSRLLDEGGDGLFPKFRVGHFAASESQYDLHLHLIAEKFDGMVQLEVEVMRVDVGPELDFLELAGVAVFLGVVLFLRLLVLVLAEIDDSADGRSCVGGNLHQVQSFVSGHLQRCVQGDDTELLAGLANEANLCCTDFPVDSDLRSEIPRLKEGT